jgi:LmbE family N-acetylglucosaminyl deacetylase
MYEQTIPGGVVPYAFQPQMFVDISDTIDIKMNSVCSHESQVIANGEWWEYGVKGRAMYRGYQIHKKYAEAFEVIKDIKTID